MELEIMYYIQHAFPKELQSSVTVVQLSSEWVIPIVEYIN